MSKFQRRHYESIADTIQILVSDAFNDIDTMTVWKVGREFADMLAADNPKFDRSKFLDRCGINDD